jgi:aminoglycoside phosphotransferase (APT) family kinase protein
MTAGEDFSARWFAGYMRHRTGSEIAVDRFEKFTRGTSRQTWFVTYRTDANAPEAVVIRTDHPGAGDPTPLDQEFSVYERLGRLGLPVARALWWEDDLLLSPRPFYVRDLVEGGWNLEGYTRAGAEGARVRLRAAQAHMRALAAVHDADWSAAGLGDLLGAPADEQAAADFYVDLQMHTLSRFAAEPQPLLHEVAAFLRARAPRAARVCLCKGTNGLGEEVFRDGRIVALSDWEEAWIGDPASDLAMVQGFTEPIDIAGERLWDLEIALAFYNEVAAVPVALDNVRFYQLARLFGRMVMFAYTATVVRGSAEATVRQSWTATEVQHAVKRALAASLGLGSPPDAALFEELNQSVEMLAGSAS